MWIFKDITTLTVNRMGFIEYMNERLYETPYQDIASILNIHFVLSLVFM